MMFNNPQRKEFYLGDKSSKDRVMTRYPHASLELGWNVGLWTVFDITPSECRKLNETDWPQKRKRKLLGYGNTEEEAWRMAAHRIISDDMEFGYAHSEYV